MLIQNGLKLVRPYLPSIITDYAGKTLKDTTANANISTWTNANTATSLLTPSALLSCPETQSVYDYISKLDNSVYEIPTLSSGAIPQHLFAFNVIADIEKVFKIPVYLTGDAPTDLTNKIAWVKNNVNTITCNWWGYGSCPSGNKANTAIFSYNGQSYYQIISNTASSPNVIHQNLNSGDFNTAINPDGFIYFLAYSDPSDGVTVSQINTDYVNLEIQFKN